MAKTTAEETKKRLAAMPKITTGEGKKLNLHEKLVEIRKVVPYLQKEASGYQFKYTSSSQVLAAVRTKMDELGVLLVPTINDKNLIINDREKVDNKGKTTIVRDYFTELMMVFTWVNAENPEEQIHCSWYGQGLDQGEKGVGKALTYNEKYFILKFFNIPTDKDDPDSFQEKGEKTAAKAKGVVTKTKVAVPSVTIVKLISISEHKKLEIKIRDAGTDREKVRAYIAGVWKDSPKDINDLHLNEIPFAIYEHVIARLDKEIKNNKEREE